MKKVRVWLVVCLGLAFASIASAQGSNAELNGNYAFTFDGITGANGGSNGFAGVGRFTADGAGSITNGELDTNAVGGGLAAQGFTGTYSIGADHRGVMALNIGGSTKRFAIATLADGSAKFIETDAVGGAGTIGSGRIERSDASAYSTAQINGNYALGIAGQDNMNNRAAIVGRFTSAGAGTLTNVAGDVNAYGTVSALTFSSATYTVSNTATGRGTMHLSFTFSGGATSLNLAFYIVNSGKLFAMVTDPVTHTTPLLNGIVQRQAPPGGSFTNASLNGNMVLYMTGLAACGNVNGTVPKAVAGVLTSDGAGNFSLTFDENFCSAPRAVFATPGTYTVESNGRTTMALDGDGVVGYLVGANTGFLFSTDPTVLLGFGEPQAAGALTNSSVTGPYAGVATDPTAFTVNVFSGEFSANGANPAGSLTGHLDIGNASGSQSGASFASTYAVTSSPVNGRGTVNLTSPSGGSAVAYVISPNKFVVVPMSDPNPAVWEFNRAPSGSATSTLSALSLNPTSVTGGASSTGTVTLSGPAPSGGAVVSLSSNNTNAARVPASVTVAAGATSASFTVSTSAVSATTTVTITAVYAGTTRTASLTVNPGTPPPVTLSSLTLNPTTVTGGTQSSTGTVTLSGPAPSGGAVVSLSSNNTNAARVPASVTVAAGATSASFAVSTSAVSNNTTVTISGTYAGTTRTAALMVRLQQTPPVTLSSLAVNPTSVTGGTQSSTGTVTLSGPAPTGGAVVSLSSSNTGAARVPASVTVAAGATSASFTVNTSAVATSTTVTIAAAYAGTTRTAALTVRPLLLPTVASLTLNPASVVGGLQSSTGTVTLSAAAPPGGAVVALSKSNSAASIPASVTVPAGVASASFRVYTSIVLVSTSTNITASYRGTSRTATLSVLL
jgi:hypothetical protein